MEEKNYSSFDEIDRDLAILMLEREIHRQKIKFHFEKSKATLSFGNLIADSFDFSKESKSTWISTVFNWIVPVISKFVKNKTE